MNKNIETQNIFYIIKVSISIQPNWCVQKNLQFFLTIISYIFSKYESSKKYEGVIFLVVPPNHTFTHLCLLLVGSWLPLLLVFDLEWVVNSLEKKTFTIIFSMQVVNSLKEIIKNDCKATLSSCKSLLCQLSMDLFITSMVEKITSYLAKNCFIYPINFL